MGKKNKKKTKWVPLDLENQSEKGGGIQDEIPSKITHNSPEFQPSNGNVTNLQPSINEKIHSSYSPPSRPYYQFTHHPMYPMALPIPRVFCPNSTPQNNYRPLQSLDWFNLQIPANCQLHYAMAPRVPRYIRPRGYQAPFYWNSVLLNPYSSFASYSPHINQDDTISAGGNSGYIYPGHYYGPASFTTNDLTQPQPNQEDNNIAGDRRIQPKKRKRKRKGKLHLKAAAADPFGSCTTLGDESVASSDTRTLESTISNSMDSDQEDLEISSGEVSFNNMKETFNEIPSDKTPSLEDTTSQVEVCETHSSRDHQLHLPLVDNLFAVNLVDEIVSKAIEIAVQREDDVKLDEDNDSLSHENVTEVSTQQVQTTKDDEGSLSVTPEEESFLAHLSKPDNESTSVKEMTNEVITRNEESKVDFAMENLHLENILPTEDDDVADAEVRELTMNMGDEEELYPLPSTQSVLVASEGDVNDNVNNGLIPNIEPDAFQVGGELEGELEWSKRNGHIDDDDDVDEFDADGNGRELVTEIVFISETSFMDESQPIEYGDENSDDRNMDAEELSNVKAVDDEEESHLSELDEDCKLSQTETAEDEDEELTGEKYMDIGDHQQFYDPLKIKDYYQICTSMDVPDSPLLLDKTDKSSQPSFDVVTNQPSTTPKIFPRDGSQPKELEAHLPNRHAEIVVHEMDNVSECGSEDVDIIGHRYQKGDVPKNIYVNQLSLAAELLKAQQDIPYDEEFKPLEEGQTAVVEATCLQDTATTSHSNCHIYQSYYGNTRDIEMGQVNISQPKPCKEVSDSGVQSEESGDEDEAKVKASAQGSGSRSAYQGVLGSNAKPLSSMLKGKSNTDPLCLCCCVM